MSAPWPDQPSGTPQWERGGHARPRRGQDLPHLAIGIFLTLLGVLLTLDSLNVVDASRALRFWPIGFYVLGGTILARRPDAHARFWAIVWLVVGTWLLLNSLGLARIGFWELVWPLALIAVGVRLVLYARNPPAPTSSGLAAESPAGASPPSGATPVDAASDPRPNLVAVFSEAKNRVTRPFAGASLTSVLGGSQLDLRQALVRPGESVTIEVLGFMGGLEVVLPPSWRVTFDVVSVFSASEDKRLPAVAGGAGDMAPPEVIVRGVTVFSALTVKD